jgi:hypothetical protein
MVEINGTQYKLCLLDTNIISEIIKNRDDEFAKYFNNLFHEGFLPCFSLFSVIELQQRPDLFSKFLDIFSVFPSVVLKGHSQIFDEEIENYPHFNIINPLLLSPVAIEPYKNLSKRQTVELVFKSEPYLSLSKRYLGSRNSDLDELIANSKAYLPKKDKYSEDEIWLYMQTFVLRHLLLTKKTFVDKKKGKEVINIDAFPSQLMMAHSIFYKFYEDRQRKPSQSDVFDIIISALVPYVDAFITERNQADAIRKIRNKKMTFLPDIKILTIKDLRALSV